MYEVGAWVTVTAMKKLLVLIAALALFAVGCKSDTTIDASGVGADADAAAAVPDEEPTAAPQDDDAPTAVPDEEPTAAPQDDDAPTAVPDEEPTSAPTESDPGAAKAIRAVAQADNWCEAAAVVDEGVEALDTLFFGDPVVLERGLTQALAVMTASARLVPNEIADDLDQTIEGFGALVTALDDVNWTFVDLDLSIIEELDGAMEVATYNIEAYNFTECGIGLDPGLPPVIAEDGTTEGSDDLPEFEGTIRDQAVLGLVEAGFTEAEANCLFENLDFTDPAVLEDVTALLEVFTDCGISLDRLAQLGGG